ncbi:MAG: DUF4159 domain-containing protein [Alphaproteobacteria bacterium]|nr:DUF4159 domain-containing protein [Alphaproteobacteria bacterium]
MGLETFAFASPWILTALLALPLLWWLLRITPPAPKQLRFPAVRLLFNLSSKEETPDASPLWLIILRLTAAALMILALAHPLFSPAAPLPGNGPVVIVVDDGWAAAGDWQARQDAMSRIINQADRGDRPIIVLATAPTAQGKSPEFSGLLRPAQARSLIAAIEPKPWPTDRVEALKALDGTNLTGTPAVIWLSDGLGGDGVEPFAERLRRIGKLTVLSSEILPHVVLPPAIGGSRFDISLRRGKTAGEEQVSVRASGGDGRLIAREAATFKVGSATTSVSLDLPLELRNAIARLEIEGDSTAAATALLDTRWRRRPVGLVSETPLDAGPALLSELYYIERALRPSSELRRGPVDRLIAGSLAVIVVPDSTPLNAAERGSLAAWAGKGGMVLRVAGPRLAQNMEDQLVPVPLRRGGRTLGGAMLWTQPARLAPFNRKSPFFDLKLPADVTISRQVLAEPSPDLGEKSWARLTDGTPLVTANQVGDGWVVLIHTTANAAWSNLALSGLFVEMLERIVSTSRGVAGTSEGDRPLAPISLLNGFGHPVEPGPSTQAINARDFKDARVAPRTPPGIYGDVSGRRALNLGPQIGALQALPEFADGVARQSYAPVADVDLKPWLLTAALILLMVDMLATLMLRGLLPWLRPGATAAVFAIALLAANANDASAQVNDEDFALKATLETRLAYIKTGDPTIDDTSLRGLTGLSRMLNQRTAVEAAAPIGIDVEQDSLTFFPLLYWPVTETQPPVSEATIGRLNRFMATGGTILFDLLDGAANENAGMLRRLTRGLDIPPLTPVPPAHVLTKAFYLMQAFPGRWADGRVWVERPGERVNDGVSSIIVGSNNWAAAWAVDEQGRHLFPAVPGGERQREMAYRFGVNLVMYTLTGNYKSDQVHVPSILERLGN